MTMQSKDDEGRPGNNYTVRARAPRRLRQLGHRRDRPVARSRPATATTSTASPASTRTSGSSEPQPQRLRGAIRHAGRDDQPGFGEGVDRLGRQREAAAGVDHDDRRRLSRRPRLRAPHRRARASSTTPRGCRSPSRCAGDGIRQLQPHARVWIYNDPSGDLVSAARSRRRSDDVEQRRVHRIRVRAARRGHHDAVHHLIPASPFRPAATTGRSTCCCSRAITAGALGIDALHASAISGAAPQRNDAGERALSPDLPHGVRSRPAGERHRPEDPAGRRSSRTLVNLRTGYSFSSNMFLDSLCSIGPTSSSSPRTCAST